MLIKQSQVSAIIKQWIEGLQSEDFKKLEIEVMNGKVTKIEESKSIKVIADKKRG